MPDELEWLSSSVAYFADGKQWPFVTPMDLLRFKPLPPLARIRLGLAVLALQRGPGAPGPFERVTARKWIERYMGKDAYRALWGPLLRGKFGERRRRRRDGVAAEQAAACGAATTPPRRSSATRSAPWEPLFHALRDQIEVAGGNVFIDRPVAKLSADFTVTPGAPSSFRKGHDPRDFDDDRARALRRGARHPPERRLRARPRARPCCPSAYLAKAARDRVLHGALPAAASSTAGSRRTTGPTSATTPLPFVGPDRAHEPDRARQRYGGRPLPLRRQLPAARSTSCCSSTPDALLERYMPGCRADQPRVRPLLGQANRGCTTRAAPPSRSSPSATARRSRR